ncbi:MAG TPA: glycine--tRNA ligase [Candidatus Nanoarchaeia archaeon]|nr:glycine--tRNA ligase [Candidatus Nanoarchaeia archaeon]
MERQKITIEEMATFCKRKGFVYQNSEIYGGLAGFYDFGHLGAELKNNIKQEWWNTFVRQRDDVVGIDASVINHPGVWKASGHVDGFTDILVDCRKCNSRFRADHLVEDKLKISTAGMGVEELSKKIKDNKLKCIKCGNSDFGESRKFNLMFSTNIGPVQTENSVSYLRPETAQLMFTNFKLVQENARLKLPFGIAQMGKAFRNEISPRDFLFRMREFELMEIEYFVHPEKYDGCPYTEEILDHEINIYSAEMQALNKNMEKMTIKHALENKIIKTKWHAYWMVEMHRFFINLGADPEHFRIRQHVKDELSHYALDTWDLEYEFPFGWKELQGFANRTDFDLKQHMENSKSDLTLFDEESKKKIIPHVICEPAQGVERAFLVFLFDAYHYDKKRENVVLKLHPKLCPVKIGVFPLVSNKPEIMAKAKEIHNELRKHWTSTFDSSGSIGRRYARADESGIFATITVDFESLEDKSVTIRSRDTTEQVRVKISELKHVIGKFLDEGKLSEFGSKIG